MLKDVADFSFVVYPSWLSIRPSWDELSHIHKMGLIENRAEPEMDFVSGKFGGGVLCFKAPLVLGRPQVWSVWTALRSAATFTSFAEMKQSPLRYRVLFLEPSNEPQFGTEGTKRPRSYIPIMTPEHIGEGGWKYWVFEAKSLLARHEKMITLGATAFGIESHLLVEIPPLVKSATADWFKNSTHKRYWFSVYGGAENYGYQAAVMAYIGLHMEKEVGKSLRCVHLIASIEGEPRFRQSWITR